MSNWYFLVLSNLVYLLCAIVLLIRCKQVYNNYYTWHFEVFTAMSISFISAMYHLCDHGTECIIAYDFLINSDYLFSMLILTVGFTVHLGVAVAGMYKIAINFTIVVLGFLYPDDMYRTILPILLTNILAVLLYNYRRWTKRSKRRILRLEFLSLAIVFVVIAFSLQTTVTDQDYNTNHSIWHLFTGMAIICSTIAVMPHKQGAAAP